MVPGAVGRGAEGWAVGKELALDSLGGRLLLAPEGTMPESLGSRAGVNKGWPHKPTEGLPHGRHRAGYHCLGVETKSNANESDMLGAGVGPGAATLKG